MEEEQKEQIAENSVPKQLKDYAFKPGVSGNPAGRPKGSVSIKDSIRKFLEDNPEEFEKLCKYYLTNDKHKDLLWKMLDGMPKQGIDLETKEPIKVIIQKAGENANDNTSP